MEKLDNKPTRDYVPETWWHRLLWVLIYGSTALVLVVIGMMQLDGATYLTYSYSFEKTYDAIRGDETDCSVYEYSKDVWCGELKSSQVFIERYLIENGNDLIKNKKLTVRDAVELSKREGLSNFDLASYLIKDQKIRYKTQDHYDKAKLLSGIWTTFAAGMAWLLIGIVGINLLLYIVYGHTRVKWNWMRKSH